jgi:hypothetical protein
MRKVDRIAAEMQTVIIIAIIIETVRVVYPLSFRFLSFICALKILILEVI